MRAVAIRFRQGTLLAKRLLRSHFGGGGAPRTARDMLGDGGAVICQAEIFQGADDRSGPSWIDRQTAWLLPVSRTCAGCGEQTADVLHKPSKLVNDVFN